MSKSEVPTKGDFVAIEYTEGDEFDPEINDVAKGVVSETFDEEYEGAPDTSFMVDVVIDREVIFEGWISDDGEEVNVDTGTEEPYELTVTVKDNNGDRVYNTTVTVSPYSSDEDNLEDTTDTNGQVVFEPGEGTYTVSVSDEKIFDEKEVTIEGADESVVIQNRYKDTTLLRNDPYGKDEFVGTAFDWDYFG